MIDPSTMGEWVEWSVELVWGMRFYIPAVILVKIFKQQTSILSVILNASRFAEDP